MMPELVTAITKSLASVGGAYVYVAAVFKHQNAEGGSADGRH
jgi:hypothetical protein